MTDIRRSVTAASAINRSVRQCITRSGVRQYTWPANRGTEAETVCFATVGCS
jgi:hypothetical protein